MYRDNKTAFGQPAATTFGFGAAATPGVTPFGTPGLANAAGATAFGKPAATPGQPVFGSGATTSLFGGAASGTAGGTSVPQGGSLFGGSSAGATFGMTHQPQPTFGGFSSTAATPNIFGAAGGTTGPGTAGGGVLFGVASTSTAAVGGQQVATSNAVVPFGAASKPASAFGTLGGFGQAATAPQQTGGTLFGNTSGGMFSTGFGSTAGPATGAGTPVKFSPFMGTDTMIKNGAQQTINTRHQCITCMKEYESKSLEELRMEDYAAGRRGGTGGPAVVTPGFGATGGVFGAGSGGTTAGSLFGSNLFGGGNTNKPFGAAAPQPSTLFGGGTNTNAFGGQSMGFGTFGQQNQSIGLFGQNKSPFASTGTTGLTFGAGAPQNTGAAAQPAQPLFGAPKSAAPTSTFGTTNAFGVTTSSAPPAFGSAFGTAGTSTAAGTSVFGQPFKPSTTSAFSFGQTTQASSGLGLNLGQPSLFGSASAKPGGGTGVGGSLFGGGTSAGTSGGALFGGATNTSLGPTFGTSSMGLSTTGGSSLFSGGGTIGGLGSSLGGGTQLGQGMLGGNTGLLGGAAVQWGGGTSGQVGGLSLGTQSGGGLLGSSMNHSFLGNTQFGGGVGSNSLGTMGGPGGSSNAGTGGGAQHVMSVSSLPFGDSRLFRDLLPSSAKMDDVLKTTNPVAQKALMAGSQFKVSPHAGNAGKVKVKPLGASALSKRSLFDGLEEEDASLLTVFSPRSASKRLTLKQKPPGPMNAAADSSANSLISSLSTPSGAVTNSNGPRLSLRARLAGSSPWDNGSPVPDSESESQWLHKQSSHTKQSPNGALQVQNSNHGSSNLNVMNESASDLENTIADLRTRLDASGSTPISNLRKKDVHLETRVRQSKEAAVEDSSDEVDVSSSEVGNDDSLKGVLEGEFDNHPTGIILRRSGYYTIPSMDELATMVEEVNDGEKKIKSVVVENFTVGREGYGNVFFPDTFDVAGLNLDEIVHFRHKEIVVYPGDDDDEEERGRSDDAPPNESNKKMNSPQKPPSGSGLNRRAQVTLDRVWPIDKVTRCPVTDPERLSAMNYEGKLQRVCAQMHTRFVEYRPQTGSWVFKVDHFSKYGLSDSDDEDCPPFLPATAGATADPNALCANETNKKAKKIPLKAINKRVPAHQDDHMDQSMAEEDSMDLGRTDGWPDDGSACGKNAPGNVTIENGFHKSAAMALSPTTQVAEQLGTSTHKVQLMKASFFSDDDEIDGEYFDRRPHQTLKSGKTRYFTEKKHGKERLVKSSGELFRTQIQCRDAVIQRVGLPTDRGGEGVMMRPYGPPSTASSSSTCPLRETLSQRHPMLGASSTTSSSLLPPPHPLVHRSKMAVLKHRGHHVKNADLVKNIFPGVESQSLLLADLGLFFGRTFKCGWGPGMKLSVITSAKVVADSSSTQGEQYSHLLPLSNGRSSSDFSNLVVQQLHLLGGTRDSGAFQGWIEPHLWIQLQHSVVSFEGSSIEPEDEESGLCPRFIPRAGKDIIHAHRDQSISSAEDGIGPWEYQISSYARLVWDLCCALWGQLPELEDDREKVNYNNHKVSMARRRALSDWLQHAVEGECNKRRGKGRREGKGGEVHTNNIFNCLTRKRLLEACEAAQKKGDHFVALMLASSNWNCRAQLRKQLSSWSRVGADEFISEGRMKIIALRAAAPLLPTTSVRHGVIDCCEGLDWKRAFAMHLWYVCSPVCSITDALMEYESALSEKATDDKDDGCYAPPPVPPYQEPEYQRMEDGKLPHYDLCFHLLKLYSCRSHSLEALLNTPTHTPDPMDVRLSWLLCVSLTALGYSHLSAEARASLHQSMAALLESHGLWHWSLFPLLHLENPIRRKASVLDVLGRHVMLVGMAPNAGGDAYLQKERFVMECLHVPSSWVFYAKAKLAASLHRHGDAAWCLAKAGLWNKCHEVILNYIAADAVINENLDYLRDLLSELAPDERSRTISGWSCGGQVFWDYLQVLSEIETLMKQQQRPKVESSNVNQGYWLERLQPKLSSLCTRLISLPCKTAKDRLCQSEISKRIAHVVRALVLMMGNKEEVQVLATPSASRVLAYLVTQLPMPPDYLIQELRHLVEVHLDGVTASGSGEP